MSIKTITYWSILIQYAFELGQARMFGDEAKIKEAKIKHDAYAALCVKSDEMILDTNNDKA